MTKFQNVILSGGKVGVRFTIWRAQRQNGTSTQRPCHNYTKIAQK